MPRWWSVTGYTATVQGARPAVGESQLLQKNERLENAADKNDEEKECKLNA